MAELAKAAGISQGFLSRLERGEVGASDQTLNALATRLDVPVSDIKKGDDTVTTTTIDLNNDADLRLFTPEQVSEMTNIPAPWLRRRAGQRVIPCTYIGRTLRFSADDIRELIEMSRIDPKTGLPRKAAMARQRAS